MIIIVFSVIIIIILMIIISIFVGFNWFLITLFVLELRFLFIFDIELHLWYF